MTVILCAAVSPLYPCRRWEPSDTTTSWKRLSFMFL